MDLKDYMGSSVFLGTQGLASDIYEHMRPGLADLEKWALLDYLALPKPDAIRKARKEAAPADVAAARKAVMGKFPKEWPPPDSRGQGRQKYKPGQVHHDAEFGNIKVG